MTVGDRRHDQGVATIWTVVVAGACLLVVGLVLDGGAVMRTRSTAFDLAAGAARAGAQELDQPALATGQATLDPASAARAAETWLAVRDATGVVEVTGDTITVTVNQDAHLQILRPASVTVTESAAARAHQGGPPS